MATHQTQCPSCQHKFEITDEQLQLKSGYARCGNCKSIFSAIDHLVSTLNRTPIQPTPAVATTKPTKRVKKVADGDFTFDDNAGLGGMGMERKPAVNHVSDFDIISNFDTLPTNKIGKATQTQGDDDSWLTDLLEEEKRKEEELQFKPDVDKFGKMSRENNVSFMLDDLGINVAHEAPIEEEDYRKKLNDRFSQQVASQNNLKMPIGMMLIWLFGSLLLMGTLVAQYAIFNLDALLKKPETATHIQTVCEIAKCKLPVANPSVIKTETLSLTKAKQNNQSDLTFTLTNATGQQVIYPNLKISLRDNNDVKAQLLLAPEQYLEDDTYLMPHQIKAVKLRIDYPKSSYTQANIEPFY